MLKTLSFEFFLFEFSYFYLAEYQKKKKIWLTENCHRDHSFW